MNACVIYDNIFMFHTQNKVEKMFLKGQFDSLSNKIGVPHVKLTWMKIVGITRYIKVLQIQPNRNWIKFLYIVDAVHIVANASQTPISKFTN
jgi:hypothetical protein